MASQTHAGGTATSVAQQNQQQQLQLQQPTSTATIQGHQNNPNQMQPLQVIGQPLQNQALMPQHFYNTQGQLLTMPGNISFHPGLNHQLQQQFNPTIQVITAGKTLQPNQISAPHMLTAATSYATIPTSASNNQTYIIGHPSILQQQQTTKPGEMQKVIQPQLGTTQIQPQNIWANLSLPQLFNQNSILIRGTQPDQMFIQHQQQLPNNTSTHQHFTTMPLTAGQLPATSIASATTNGVQQVTQQQGQVQQQQSQQGQTQNQSQIQTSNLVSIKAPATLQPKPPLQIQPQPVQNQNANQNQQQQQQHQSQANQQAQNQHSAQQQHANQQLTQLQQVMSQQHQVQMLAPQQTATSQQNFQQQILAQQNSQTLTAQVMHQAQQNIQSAPRQLTILPHSTAQQIQPQVTLIQQPQQQTTQQPQPIRPNYSTASSTNTTGTQQQGITTTATPPQQRGKIRKPGVGRGSSSASPTQQQKTMFPRPVNPTTISPAPPPQLKPAPAQQQSGATLTKVPIPALGSNSQSNPVNAQPLKTINLAALHSSTPNLPDATLTPLPQPTSQTQSIQQAPPQPIQVYPTTTTQLPSPNISITPAPPPIKKDEQSNENQSSQGPPPSQQQQNNSQGQHTSENKSENEKENAKTDTSTDDTEDGSGKQKLPKAMVKPQVLTHVIEGFVIQEASEPFPLGRNGDSDEPPMKKVALSGDMGKCEMCGKVDLRSKFKKNKRFCSSQCAKGMKAQQQQQLHPPSAVISSAVNKLNDNLKHKGRKMGEGDSELTDETSSSVGEPSYMSPTNDHADDEPKVNPVKWNVSEVVDFVKSLPGCAEYADDFALQEIDGQALMLLKEDHLMSAMGMKLGPALKLCAKIEAIKAGMSSANGEGNQGKG